MKSILSTVIVLCCLNSAVMAKEGNKGFCQNAETTADLMACIGAHYQAALGHMEDLYNTLKENADEQSAFQTALAANQKDWIAYRDDICDLEGQAFEGGSLEPVQKLDCLARVTDARSEHFKRIIEAGDETKLPVFASPPLWTNALLKDYPNAFWALGQARRFDTDCDKIEEKLITGRDDDAYLIALADSQLTGRPTIHLLNNVTELKDCTPVLPLKLTETSSEDHACAFSVAFVEKECQEISFSYEAASDRYKAINKDEAQ